MLPRDSRHGTPQVLYGDSGPCDGCKGFQNGAEEKDLLWFDFVWMGFQAPLCPVKMGKQRTNIINQALTGTQNKAKLAKWTVSLVWLKTASEDQLLLKVQLFIIYGLYNHSCIISYVAFSVGDAKLISTSRGRSSLFFETAAILSVQHFLEILTITLVFSGLSKDKYTLNNDHNQPFSKVFSSLAWLLYVPLWQLEGGGGWLWVEGIFADMFINERLLHLGFSVAMAWCPEVCSADFAFLSHHCEENPQ